MTYKEFYAAGLKELQENHINGDKADIEAFYAENEDMVKLAYEDASDGFRDGEKDAFADRMTDMCVSMAFDY